MKYFFNTLVSSLLGGFLFYIGHIPLPWMLGPLSAALIVKYFFKRETYWPIRLRNAGLIILGYKMGISFTPETGGQILNQLANIALSTVLIIILSIPAALIVHRVAGVNFTTSIVGSIPGGLSQMVVLSEEIKDCDATVVTLMQTTRLLAVVFIVPFLTFHAFTNNLNPNLLNNINPAAGSGALPLPQHYLGFAVALTIITWASIYLKFPTPYLIGPIIGSALPVLYGWQPPQFSSQLLIIIAQICIGTYMGYSIRIANLTNWQKLIPASIIGTLIIILTSLGISYYLSVSSSVTFVSAFLGTAPGGMSEMGVTATAVNADLSIVTAYQLFRLLFILFIVPPAIKWYFLK